VYDRILPLVESDRNHASEELKALGQVWVERKSSLEQSGEFQEFLKKLQREWAIETGIIERLYSWERGVTEVLIEHGIDASMISHRGGVSREKAETINAIIGDQLGIIEGLFEYIKGDRPLTEHFIRGLQAQFTAHQETTEALSPDGKIVQVPMKKGEYKINPNNPRRPDGETHEYCPPELVQEEMSKLVSLYGEYENKYQPEVLSAWLHHRFTQIHPFQDGNGRVARTLASLVFLKARYFPIVVRDQERKDYIEALENADKGELGSLVTLFVKRQKSAILSALGIEQQVQQQGYSKEIIAAALTMLKDRLKIKSEELDRVYDAAERLRELAAREISAISNDLDDELKKLPVAGDKRYHANCKSAENESDNRHFFYSQIVKAAKQFGYYANLNEYRSWVRLAIATETVFEFVVSFHGLGSTRNGVLVCSAFTFNRVPSEGEGSEFVNVRPCVPEVFQFNYAEPQESTDARFRDWLESACAIALSEWKRQLDTSSST